MMCLWAGYKKKIYINVAGLYLDVPNVNKLSRWDLSRVLASHACRRPGYESRQGHVRPGTSSSGMETTLEKSLYRKIFFCIPKINGERSRIH
jgi:hypothetical protein